MPIEQLANCSDISPMELISHAQTIYGKVRDKADESRQLSAIASAASDLGKSLGHDVKAIQKRGARVIVCEENGVELDVKKVVKMLKESSDTLHNLSKKLDFHARAYDSQLKSHDHLMSGFLSRLPLGMRVATCEKQANGWMTQQKNYLQSNMAKIEEAEMDVVGFQQMIGIDANALRLKPAAQLLLDSL
jgi:hypothetical protein